MKYLRILNDKSKRLVLKKNEVKKKVIFLVDRQKKNLHSVSWKKTKLRKISRVNIKNYCILSGRARGVFRNFKLSRILLRKMGEKGFLSGLKKKSW